MPVSETSPVDHFQSKNGGGMFSNVHGSIENVHIHQEPKSLVNILSKGELFNNVFSYIGVREAWRSFVEHRSLWVYLPTTWKHAQKQIS